MEVPLLIPSMVASCAKAGKSLNRFVWKTVVVNLGGRARSRSMLDMCTKPNPIFCRKRKLTFLNLGYDTTLLAMSAAAEIDI